mmetsp:Transcript_64508/g.185428  ORF Transcript_64508/g.185428 Transcript_64508/m.185428 type:complete len:318 (-) Transcript_64508:1723-2676(-)
MAMLSVKTTSFVTLQYTRMRRMKSSLQVLDTASLADASSSPSGTKPLAHAAKTCSTFLASSSAWFACKNRCTSAGPIRSAPSGAIAWKRSTALPPFASMQVRNLPATSLLSAPNLSKDFDKAPCFASTIADCALTNLSDNLFTSAPSLEKSGPNASVTSEAFANSKRKFDTEVRNFAKSLSAPCTEASTVATKSIISVSFRSTTFCVKSSASLSTACVFPSNSPVDFSKPSSTLPKDVFFSDKRCSRAARFSASTFSRASDGKLFTLPRSWCLAMPTAVFNRWNRESSTPLPLGSPNWRVIRSSVCTGMSNWNSALA